MRRDGHGIALVMDQTGVARIVETASQQSFIIARSVVLNSPGQIGKRNSKKGKANYDDTKICRCGYQAWLDALPKRGMDRLE